MTKIQRLTLAVLAVLGHFGASTASGQGATCVPSALTAVTWTRWECRLAVEGTFTGRKGYATPTGKYVISDKQRDWISTIYKVSMPFFMRLSCREIGLHAGNCPGYPASHGCIRMPYSDVQKLFAVLKIGDAVTIEE